jgi:hypothetical protein
MAGYFVVAMVFAVRNGHYVSMPFLALFLCGFWYVGWGSLWQGQAGAQLRAAWRRLGGRGHREATTRGVVVPPPAYPRLSAARSVQRRAATPEAWVDPRPPLRPSAASEPLLQSVPIPD